MNIFRCTPDKSLDKVYLRTCVVYRLLKRERIGKARAAQLLKVSNPLRLIELWQSGPLKNMKA
jgi:hypothetical protein